MPVSTKELLPPRVTTAVPEFRLILFGIVIGTLGSATLDWMVPPSATRVALVRALLVREALAPSCSVLELRLASAPAVKLVAVAPPMFRVPPPPMVKAAAPAATV